MASLVIELGRAALEHSDSCTELVLGFVFLFFYLNAKKSVARLDDLRIIFGGKVLVSSFKDKAVGVRLQSTFQFCHFGRARRCRHLWLRCAVTRGHLYRAG